MKKFNSIREESLLEKLKASDPTGKWISDFVHSDNPKFAGKSKKERIRMALGASYAAKRNEEVELEEGTYKHDVEKAFPAPGVKTIQPKHKYSTMPTDKEKAKAQPAGKMKEEVEQVDELKTSTLMRYNTKAHASANKLTGQASQAMDNDDRETASKLLNKRDNREVGIDRSRAKIQKNVANKLKKEEVEYINEASFTSATSMYAATRKQSGNKTEQPTHNIRVGDTVKTKDNKKGSVVFVNGDEVHVKGTNSYYPNAIQHHSSSDLKKEEVEQIDELKKSTLRSYVKRAASNVGNSVAAKFLDAGGQHARGEHKEAGKSMAAGAKRIKGISRAVDKLAKEAVQIEEGSAQGKLYGIQQKLRQKSKLPNPEYYKEMGKAYDIKDDAERMTKQSEIKKKYGVSEASQLDQLKAMRDNPQWQKDPEHKAQLDKRVKMAQDRQDLDAGEVVNKAGKPIPVLTPDKYKEKNPNFMKESDSREDKGEYDYEGDMAMSDLRSIMHNAKSVHDMLKPNTNLPEWCQSKITLAEDYVSTVANYMQATMSEETNSDFVSEESEEHSGIGVSRSMQMAKDLADSNARRVMMQKKYGENFSDKQLPKTTSRYEFSPGEKPGTYRATAYHKEVSEAKKMKGPDPCWDDYKMIGTKMKNGKQVPNCVPEQVQLEEIKRGLYANIHAKRKRIAKGSGERMRKPGTKGAPTAQAFRDSAKTAKK
jgi:hypothetical protein